MFVRVLFAMAIQAVAVGVVLRVNLQGNVGDAFGLNQAFYRLAYALRLGNGGCAVQHKVGGEQMAVAGERPQVQIVHAQYLRHGLDFGGKGGLVDVFRRALH